MIGVVWISRAADDEVAAAAVDDHSIKPKQAPITGSSD
jgi:hypothetical protein